MEKVVAMPRDSDLQLQVYHSFNLFRFLFNSPPDVDSLGGMREKYFPT